MSDKDLLMHFRTQAWQIVQRYWRRRGLVVTLVITTILLAAIGLFIAGPRYTGEAIVQLNFSREQPASGAQSQQIAALDGSTLVETAARIIRSRATASAVVKRLGLDKDSRYARPSFLRRVMTGPLGLVGIRSGPPTTEDIATNALLQDISATYEVRSYLISIKYTTDDPERAANIANAFALEYLRGQLVSQLVEEQSAAEREMSDVSRIYADRHPTYEAALAKLQRLRARLQSLRNDLPTDDVTVLTLAQPLLPAKRIAQPSGPNVPLVLGIATGFALLLGALLTARLDATEKGAEAARRTGSRSGPWPIFRSGPLPQRVASSEDVREEDRHVEIRPTDRLHIATAASEAV